MSVAGICTWRLRTTYRSPPNRRNDYANGSVAQLQDCLGRHDYELVISLDSAISDRFDASAHPAGDASKAIVTAEPFAECVAAWITFLTDM